MLEAILRYHQIPYSLSGGPAFFDRKEIRDIMAYLRSSLTPNEVSLRRVINTPSRGIGDTTIKQIEDYSKAKGISFIKATYKWREAGVSVKIGESIDRFYSQLKELPHRLIDTSVQMSSGQALLHYFTDIGYRHTIYKNFKDPSAAQKRWAIVETFARVLDAFIDRGGRTVKTLKDFMDAMELRDNVEDQEKEDKVQLLTLHASKGLEFPVVIMIGIEEDILPHKTLGGDINEERRLFYVGVTRAKEKLVLSHARQRKKYGRWQPSAPSRFLIEVPQDLMQVYEGGARPISEVDRKSMMADLFKKIDSKVKS